jgi:hypothetical protein
MTDPKDIRLAQAVAHELSLEQARNAKKTPELQARARAVMERTRDHIAELRREDRTYAPVAEATIRPSILAMAIDAVRERLRELFVAHPDLQLAHRDFREMSDDDLRSLLEDIESVLERE